MSLLAPRPNVLVADEAVSALDLSVRTQILNLFAELIGCFALSVMLISHDIGVVRHLCDREVVLHRGKVVEEGMTEDVLTRPMSSYTRGLLAATPRLGTQVVGDESTTLGAVLLWCRCHDERLRPRSGSVREGTVPGGRTARRLPQGDAAGRLAVCDRPGRVDKP